MARHIDADKLIWQVQNNDKYGTITKQMFISLLQNSEMEDVAPVVHAHWIEEDDGWENPYWTCSHCREPWWLEEGTPEDNNMFFCMNCGAKMDDEVPDNA